MSTPFILGKDFADQYHLSILMEEGDTRMVLGESGLSVFARNSTGHHFVSEDGHAFSIAVEKERFPKFECMRASKK
jgi:hypothetical protein